MKAEEKKMRELLSLCIETKNADVARDLFIYAIATDLPVHEWGDLHFSLLLLLALPKKENRGRKKDKSTSIQNFYLNLACKIKADLTGSSFSHAWASYCDKTRQKMNDLELWRCAGIMQMGIDEETREAGISMRTFELSKEDLEQYTVVKK